MKLNNTFAAFLVAAMGFGAVMGGCSSTSDCSDGGSCASDSAVVDSGVDTGLFGLTPGTYCFDIVSVVPGFADGCDLGVGADVSAMGLVGSALPVTFDVASSTVTLGTNGSLGAGTISHNMGTLTRDNMPTDPTMATCNWHQTDTTMFVLTNTNEFTASVVENESNFAAAPACTSIPPGGSCTSTWTWNMKITATKSPTNGCK